MTNNDQTMSKALAQVERELARLGAVKTALIDAGITTAPNGTVTASAPKAKATFRKRAKKRTVRGEGPVAYIRKVLAAETHAALPVSEILTRAQAEGYRPRTNLRSTPMERLHTTLYYLEGRGEVRRQGTDWVRA